MTVVDQRSTTPRGWPFFAPSEDDAIREALELVNLGKGDRLVDLGSGEGHVLLAAAQGGAEVLGIECDADLAATARAALEEEGLPGEVVVGDLFDPAVYGNFDDAERTVLFAYLSPASLQRLTPVVTAWAGCRLVTIDFDVPDWSADGRSGAARLYRVPGRRRARQPDALGWPAAGSMCIMPPRVNSLTSLELTHQGGPVEVAVQGSVARHAAVAVGADYAEPGAPVAIDLRWRERSEGTLAQGVIEVEGAHPHPITVLFAEEEQGQWDLSPDGCADLDARLRKRSLPRPTSTRELLAAMGL